MSQLPNAQHDAFVDDLSRQLRRTASDLRARISDGDETSRAGALALKFELMAAELDISRQSGIA